MGFFVARCQQLGVTKVAERRVQLQRAAGVFSHNEMMFFICGYDYISAPSASKFRGLKELYLTQYGPMSTYMNFGHSGGTPPWVSVRLMLQGLQGQAASDIAAMHKALDYAADMNMIVNGMLRELQHTDKPPMDDKSFLAECTQLAELHAPYWGGELSRLGLQAHAAVSLKQKFDAKFDDWKKARHLGNVNNVMTRTRQSRPVYHK